jgi:hypothetical protein
MSSGSRRFQSQIFVASLENGGLPALVEELNAEDIELVLDIRRWPARHWRRHPPEQLAPLLADADVYYLHRPELGPNPQQWLPGGDHWKLDSRDYRRLLHSREDSVAWVAGLALRHRTCIVSQFDAPNDADRMVLADEIGKMAGLRRLALSSRPQGRMDPTRPAGWTVSVSAANVSVRWLDSRLQRVERKS